MKTFKYCHVDFLSIIPFSNKYHSSTWLTTSQFPNMLDESFKELGHNPICRF